MNVTILLQTTSGLSRRYRELNTLIAAPEIIADNRLYRRLVLERAELEDAALCREELKKKVSELTILETENDKDNEMQKLLLAEIEQLRAQINTLAERLNLLIKPTDTEDNALVEIKAENGDAQARFGEELVKMYRAAAFANGWAIEEETLSNTTGDGIKKATLLFSGMGAYNRFAFENGIHRASGLTNGKYSFAQATVVVLRYLPYTPQEIAEKDLRIDLYHSGGAGGQNVNKVETAVRITHIPTGITAACQDERSQLKNKKRALDILGKKLEVYYKKQKEVALSRERKEKLAEARRNDKMRTYDYITGEITDHRTGNTIKLSEAEDGALLSLTDNIHLLKT